MSAPAIATRAAALLRVRGLVQGVGFRPFVSRLAARHSLGGWVRNTAGDVQIALEGPPDALDAFVAALRSEAPPLARIESVERTTRTPEGRGGFTVAPSTLDDGRQPVSPDVAACSACERELFDPDDRRWRYPFVTCTDCGPRFSVIEAMPYDRERTSMRAFAMCEACRREYETPGDRRFHSQTNSCPDCGPALWLADGKRAVLVANRRAAIEAAADRLRMGGIVAVRGLGGFQLAADATDELAVRRLRVRKQREAKPLAVMVRGLDEARRLAFLTPAEEELLASPERPVVVVHGRALGGLSRSVAPGLRDVGLMLPTTPLHHLLLDAARRPLVMTSGNRSDEPIAISNDEALRRLAGIADVFLLHDREIVARYDDSVVRVAGSTVVQLRRARGYAPLPVRLPIGTPVPLIAVGPHLKNTLTLAADDRAWVSQHVGDLDDLETLEQFEAVRERLGALFRIAPRVAVRDLHPAYLTTRFANELGLERVIPVQHHHAHVAAVAAEHGVTAPVVGLACDGTGYGDDGTVWGCELFVADLNGYRRVGHLAAAPLPGGDLAARRPWRAALGYLAAAPGADAAFARAFDGVDPVELCAARVQTARGINAPRASSLGRLFDAAAAVLGLRRESRYEGHAAMQLESAAARLAADVMPLPVRRTDGRLVLDPVPLLVALGERAARGTGVPELAAVFHDSIATALADLALEVCSAEGLRIVVLGGGSFQNARLLTTVRERLARRGITVLVPTLLPPNDGAISYGQAAIAAAVLAQEGGR